MSSVQPCGLVELARLYNVQTVYSDFFGRRRRASPEALIRVLQALGAPLTSMDRLQDALRERRQSMWQTFVGPVVVSLGREALPELTSAATPGGPIIR